MDVASLAELLRETSDQHDVYEKSHSPHNWWEWYASYINAREQGSTPAAAADAAARYMADVWHVTAI